MLRTRYDVFLSYSRADGDRVKPLRDELRRLGYRVFFDVQSIDPGERWKDRLDRAVRASRTLVLCWSEHAHGSDYITFEYSRAEALKKPVYPWLMDVTPLPAMLEIQGIPNAGPTEVAAALKPKLGWPMRLRWARQAVLAGCIAAVAIAFAWKKLHPPPWDFSGRIVDAQTLEGIPSAAVTLADTPGHPQAATDSAGTYRFSLPQPRAEYLHLRATKDGYAGEERRFSTAKPPDDWPLEKTHAP